MTTLLAINPRSRSGDQPIAQVRRRLEALGPVESITLSGPDDLAAAVRTVGDALERIVLGGGDGTLHHALDTLLTASVPLGVLPLGTANDFARSLGLPADLDSAAEVICTGHTEAVDLGRVNSRYFLNAAGLGLGAELNDALDSESKSSLGVMAYLKTLIEVYREGKGRAVRLRGPEGDCRWQALQVTIGNGPHYGGGMTTARDAKLSDGQFTVLVIKPRGAMALLRQALLLRRGPDLSETQPDCLEVLRCPWVEIDTGNTLPVTADGEPVGETPVRCEVVPGALEVYR